MKARRTLARATALPAAARRRCRRGRGCDRHGDGAVPVWRGRAADLWVSRQCGYDVAGLGLTSGGVALSYADAVRDTVTASAAAGNTVFTFQLDTATGAWTFTLVDQLDHAPGGA